MKSPEPSKLDIAASTYCRACDLAKHYCPGCGADVPHGVVACNRCSEAGRGAILAPVEEALRLLDGPCCQSVCSCGWHGTASISADAADTEGLAHRRHDHAGEFNAH